MTPRKRSVWPILLSLAMLLAFSCRLTSGEPEILTPTAPSATSTSPATLTPRPTNTSTQALPTDTATAVVVVTFTATREAYPGPVDTVTPALTSSPLASPTEGLPEGYPSTPTFPPQGTLTPTPSFTPVFVPTFTPTLPGLLNLTGLWYGYRWFDIKNRKCEESIFHTMRWRIEQDRNYNLLVNDDLSGWLKGNVVTLSGTEYFEKGTLNLTYILTVGPTRHELRGYLYGKARLPDVCNRSGITQLSVPDGKVEVER